MTGIPQTPSTQVLCFSHLSVQCAFMISHSEAPKSISGVNSMFSIHKYIQNTKFCVAHKVVLRTIVHDIFTDIYTNWVYAIQLCMTVRTYEAFTHVIRGIPNYSRGYNWGIIKAHCTLRCEKHRTCVDGVCGVSRNFRVKFSRMWPVHGVAWCI